MQRKDKPHKKSQTLQIDRNFPTNFRVDVKSKLRLNNLAQNESSEVTICYCVCFPNMQDLLKKEDAIQPGRGLQVLKEHFIALLSTLASIPAPATHKKLVLYPNPDAPEFFEAWVKINKELLMHPMFKDMIFCVQDSKQKFTKQMYEKKLPDYEKVFDGIAVTISEFRNLFPNFGDTEEFIANMVASDGSFTAMVDGDSARYLEKINPSCENEEEKRKVIEECRATVIREDSHMVYMVKDEGPKHVLLCGERELFKSFRHLQNHSLQVEVCPADD